MKKKRVMVLMHRDLVPPKTASKKLLETAEWKTEYYVTSTLRKLGHEVEPLGVISDLSKISAGIREFKPHIFFNLLEEFDGEATYDQNVVSFLELKRQAYTGNTPRGLILARDKALSKKILSYHRIPVPQFQVFPLKRRVRRLKALKFPLIVKSLNEEASLGISQSSVVTNDEKLQERISFIHDSFQTHAIAETYIAGRELYVAILGNRRLEIFSPWELVFQKAPESFVQIATSRVKHSPAYRKKHRITTYEAKNLDEATLDRIRKVCKRTYGILSMSGYARIDLRLSPEGIPFVLEANPNPEIADYEDFSMAAYYGGYEYPELLEKIVDLGLKRPKL